MSRSQPLPTPWFSPWLSPKQVCNLCCSGFLLTQRGCGRDKVLLLWPGWVVPCARRISIPQQLPTIATGGGGGGLAGHRCIRGTISTALVGEELIACVVFSFSKENQAVAAMCVHVVRTGYQGISGSWSSPVR